MQLIDTHCHLTHGRLLPDVGNVLARARAAGVTAFICVAADLAESRASLGLARREKDVFCLAGVHPHEAKECVGDSEKRGQTPISREKRGLTPISSAKSVSVPAFPTPDFPASQEHNNSKTQQDAGKMPATHEGRMPSTHPDWLLQIEELAADARNVGIGEIGLDYHYDFSPRPDQRRVFAEQLELAGRLGKNVVIHTREAFDDTLAIIAQSGIDGRRIVFHSFTENVDAARRVLDLGATISFSGIVTFAKSHELQRTALMVPAERILVETDAPYLSPEPVRKMKTNEPANVSHVAAFLARLRGLAAEDFAGQTTENTRRFFALPI